MQKNKTNFIISIIVALVFLGGIGYFASAYASKPGEYDDEAKCLAEKGAKMYGAWWCPHCKKQKDDFGKSFKYINYVECAVGQPGSGQVKECDDAGIKSYPTWKFPDGTVFEGEQSIQKLAETAKCEIQK